MAVANKNIPFLAYIFLAAVVALPAFKFYLSMNTRINVFDIDEDLSPYDFSTDFLIHPRVESSPKNDVLVLVTTIASEYSMRQKVRSSWANLSRLESDTVRVEFLMGRPPDLKNVQEEHETYNDIIVADLTEGYYGLAAKTISMLTYKMKFYKNAKCLVKADIDNVLILRNYVRLCEETVAPLILGKCDVARTVKRNVTKWAVPEYVWPYPTFPPYCSSGTYVLAGKNLPQILVNEAKRSQFSISANFRKLSEDVVITGILAERAGIRRRHLNGLSFFEIPEFFCRNSYKHTYSVHLVRDKNPQKWYRKLMTIEGQLCKWWDIFGVRKWR